MMDKTTPREEDYRDYEERDISEGWPYADDVSGSETKVRNRSYGEGTEAFDESGNPGFETGDGTARIGQNGPDILTDDPGSDTDDDALEEMINDALDAHEIDTSSIEIKVERGVATVSGEVETQEERHRISALVSAIPGIGKVRNALSANAVDANLPADWND